MLYRLVVKEASLYRLDDLMLIVNFNVLQAHQSIPAVNGKTIWPLHILFFIVL